MSELSETNQSRVYEYVKRQCEGAIKILHADNGGFNCQQNDFNAKLRKMQICSIKFK